tara:strand:+ start:146 stop:847 length:702 start_codon:yes stop_codon:yes gene_type:complete
MCTVTFIPVDTGVIITHNRDEKITRLPSDLPKATNHFGKNLWYPKDTEKNGTWFSADEKGRVACILNGAFKKHTSTPPYRKSRGLVLLDAFNENSFNDWLDNYNLDNIEPFTLILFENAETLFELRWDGDEKHIKTLATNIKHIWSSSTLYSPASKEKRKNWLNTWLEENPTTAKSLLDFHNYGGDGSSDINLKMEILGSHKTVSITQFYSNKNERFIDHINFTTDQKLKTNF